MRCLCFSLLWNRYKSKNCYISVQQIQQATRHRRHKNWSQVSQFTNLHYNLQFNKFLVIPRIVVLTEPGFLWNGRRLCTRCSQWAGRAGCPQLARRSSICICVCGCNCLRFSALCSCLCICVFCRRHTQLVYLFVHLLHLALYLLRPSCIVDMLQ